MRTTTCRSSAILTRGSPTRLHGKGGCSTRTCGTSTVQRSSWQSGCSRRLRPEIDTCLFVNSGSEANELAWLNPHRDHGSGRRSGDRARVPRGHYCGRCALAGGVGESGPACARGPNPRSRWISRVSSGSGDERRQGAERAKNDDAFASLRGRGFEPGVVMIDSRYTSDGIFAPPSDVSSGDRASAKAAGAGFVADEVQAGHGRTGEHLWSFTASGVVPETR